MKYAVVYAIAICVCHGNLHSQEASIPLALNNKWIYEVQHRMGLAGDTTYYDTLTVVALKNEPEKAIWTVQSSRGYQEVYTVWNDTIYKSWGPGPFIRKYFSYIGDDTLFVDGTLVWQSSETIITPFGTYFSSIRFIRSDQRPGYLEIVIPGIGVAYYNGIYCDGECFGAAGKLIGISITTTGVIEKSVANTFSLAQNYPNPFNPTTQIRFTLQSSGFTSLKVYDLLGREVATLINEYKQPGTYEIDWNAGTVSSGVYLYRLLSGEFKQTKKLLLQR